MGSYFVVLHSTPPATGDSRRRFILELAKRLGRKEQDIDILLTDLPAVVSASPTKDFAESLCQAIENLGGLAEMMAEVSGVHMSVSAKNEKSAFKTTPPPAAKPGAKALQPVTDPGLSFESSDKNRTVKTEPKKSAPKPLTPAPVGELTLSFDTPAPAPAAKPAATSPSPEASSDANGKVPEYSPAIDDLEQMLTAELNGLELSPLPSPESPQQQPQPPAAPLEAAPEAAPAAKPSAAEAPQKPKTRQSGTRPKSQANISTISPFKAGERKTKSSAKWPSIKGPKPAAAESAPPQSPDTTQPAQASSAPTPPSVAPDPELEIEATDEELSLPKPRSTQKKILFGVLSLSAVIYIVLLIKPDLVISTDTGPSVSMDNINKFLKQQDKIFQDIKGKNDTEKPKLLQRWQGIEVSGRGSTQLDLGMTDGVFDTGTLELSSPEAEKLTPEEFSRGVKPRIWLKDLIVEKLKKSQTKADQLTGKAKITLADQHSLDKIVASTILTVTRVPDSDIATGTIEIFFPQIPDERPTSEVMERDAQGQPKIYVKREFSVRLVPPNAPGEAHAATAAKRGKGIPVMPVI